MRKLISFILYCLYKLFEKRDNNIAYHTALCVFLTFLLLNIFELLGFLKLGQYMFVFINDTDSKLIRYLKIGIVQVFPLYTIIRLVFPKKKIIVLNYSERAVKHGMAFYVLYSILSMISAYFVLRH